MCARRRLSAADACGAASSVRVDEPKLNVCGSRPGPLLSATPKASSAGRFWRCVDLECRKPLSTWTLAPPTSPQARYALGHITPISLRQVSVCCNTTEVCTFEGRMVKATTCITPAANKGCVTRRAPRLKPNCFRYATTTKRGERPER